MTNSPSVAARSPELKSFAQFCALLELEDGRPFRLEAFQRRMLADYFAGATETLILVGKKNGKSTLLAALALHHLVTTPDAECVVAAASRDQASLILRQARGFIRRSDGLKARVSVKQREIVSLRDEGRIRLLASDVDTADGVLPTLALVDELHRHRSADLYGVFRDGLGPRGGRMVTISTAGDDDESPLGRMRRAAFQLEHQERDGAYRYCRSADGGYVLHEWALEPDEDRSDMRVVKRANPASWQTEEQLARRFNSPSMSQWQWARFACGVWLRGEDSAIQATEWDALADPNLEIPEGSSVWIGLDLGWKQDTTAIVPIWHDGERWVVADVMVFDPPADGSLDERLVVDALIELSERFDVLAVVLDPNTGGHQLAQTLEREHGIEFSPHSQKNTAMALASLRLSEAIRTKTLAHNGDRTLRHHVLNAVARTVSGESWRFDRPSRGPRRPIDALTALAMAHSVAVAEREAGPDLSRIPVFH